MIRSPSRPNRSQTGLLALAALAALAVTSCADKHIGRRCVISSDGGADETPPTFTSFNQLALECPSRICLRPAQMQVSSTQALCSDECGSDDDCADGEKRDPKDMTDKRCGSGFVCRTVLPKLVGVALSCKKLCVCRDFGYATEVKPEGCP
jgi:hypothetical protein